MSYMLNMYNCTSYVTYKYVKQNLGTSWFDILFFREQIMPVLNRAFEHVVPGIIPASVPTISLPDLITPGAASAIMPPNRTVVPSPSYQVPAHSLRMQNAQGYQQRLRPPLPGQIQVCCLSTLGPLILSFRSKLSKEATWDTSPQDNLSLLSREEGIPDHLWRCEAIAWTITKCRDHKFTLSLPKVQWFVRYSMLWDNVLEWKIDEKQIWDQYLFFQGGFTISIHTRGFHIIFTYLGASFRFHITFYTSEGFFTAWSAKLTLQSEVQDQESRGGGRYIMPFTDLMKNWGKHGFYWPHKKVRKISSTNGNAMTR